MAKTSTRTLKRSTKPTVTSPGVTLSDVAIRRMIGLALVLICFIAIVALTTYDWRDIAELNNPANNPPSNSMGNLGAYLTYYGYGLGGLAYRYFAIPFLGILAFMLLHGRVAYFRLRVIWILGLYTTLACIFQTFQDLPLLDTLNQQPNGGGALGEWIVTGLLSNNLGNVGIHILLWPLALTFVFLFFGFRNSLLFIMKICSRIGNVIPYESSDEAKSSLHKTEEDYRAKAPSSYSNDGPVETPVKRGAGFLARLFHREAQPEAPQHDIRDDLYHHSQAIRCKSETEWVHPQTTPRATEAPLFETSEKKPKLVPKTIPTPVTPLVQPPKPEPPPLVLTDDTAPILRPVQADNAVTAPVPALRDETSEETVFEDYGLPSTDLLDPIPPMTKASENIQASIAAIESVFNQFGLEGKVVNYIQGPVLTQFEIRPREGIRLEKYRSYESNLLMALSAERIRIQAPIPGRDVVGIEVPNRVRQSVTLREVLESATWRAAERKMALPLALGKMATGGDLIVDLAELPHLLVAGGTGSGKSVSVNGMLIGLLMSRKPEQLRLLMVDPKRVEFTAYDNLPHLLNPVVVEPKKVVFSLKWAEFEMNRRYKELQKYGVRNIGDYNRKATNPIPGRNNPPAPLPYIVVIIDELADLMMTVKADIEQPITSLTQKARAAGIHLIIATQRPTTDIITGTIKANIPGRIALRVAQANDSRTILDATGAENLIGKGDMLLARAGSTVRSQAAWVSDEEIARICDFIREQVGPAYDNVLASSIDKIREEKAADDIHSILSKFVPEQEVSAPSAGSGAEGGALLEDDGDDSDEALYRRALEYIRQTGRFSASALQRRLRIGYVRASRVADLLEERGIIGPSGKAGGSREILVDLNAMEREQYAGTDAEATIIDTRTYKEDAEASAPQEQAVAFPPPPQADVAAMPQAMDNNDLDFGAFDAQLLDSINVVHPTTETRE